MGGSDYPAVLPFFCQCEYILTSRLRELVEECMRGPAVKTPEGSRRVFLASHMPAFFYSRNDVVFFSRPTISSSN